MKICGQEFTDEIIQRIQRTVDSEEKISRVALSRRVCGWLGWRSPNGKLKEMSCRVALLKLARRNKLNLPGTVQQPAGKKQYFAEEKDQKHNPIECGLQELGDVGLVRIESAKDETSRIWNQLMAQHHYLGKGPLCGAQIRYLIKSSEKGWLGGLAFSAAAWQVSARESWIGWSKEAQRKNLAKVVNNSRFLILPWVRVPHLASRVLGLASRRLAEDWQQRYGYEPLLLETFVEKERFKGTSYRAANWIHVGSSLGRGRQDRRHARALSQKDIYLYPLKKETRALLCAGAEVFPPAPKRLQEAANWAQAEFGTADFGDERLQRRLEIMARDMYNRPQANIPQACQSRAKTKAAYRFLDHPETTMEKILEPHYAATRERIQQEEVVLAVQDTTSLNYGLRPATTGLGLIGSEADGPVGLLVHDTLAFNLAGTPLGLLDVQCWARDAKEFGKRHKRYELPIEEKESNKWLKSFEQAVRAQQSSPKTRVVSVGDREADIHELFQLAANEGHGTALLVRAERDRMSADGQGHIWEMIAQSPLQGMHIIQVPRQRQRPAREARLEVRWAEVRLKPPKRKPNLQPVRVWGILAEEQNAPENIEPLKWMLLTTLEVTTLEAAVEKLSWYSLRWGIEVYHKTLKSGCKIEERQLGDAQRIEACLAIDMVVAWRIFHLAKLGRDIPDVPCTVYFEEAEWKALHTHIHKQELPPEPPTLYAAMRMLAGLGGFLGRKGDGDPGTKSLWLGIQCLSPLTEVWKYMALTYAPHLLSSPVSSNPRYG